MERVIRHRACAFGTCCSRAPNALQGCPGQQAHTRCTYLAPKMCRHEISSMRHMQVSMLCSSGIDAVAYEPADQLGDYTAVPHQHAQAVHDQALSVCEAVDECTPAVDASDHTAETQRPLSVEELSTSEDAAAADSTTNAATQPQKPFFPGGLYSFYSTNISEHPVPVQLPPPDATIDPPEHQPAFLKSRYLSPAFLKAFPAPQSAAYNFMSFLGPLDWHGGKYVVPLNALDKFLLPYWKMAHLKKRKVYIAESYQGQPYKFFQELDFPWQLDVSVVLELIPKVINIVTEETCRVHNMPGPQPQPIISMRTPYKVHLNYPDIFTVEATARTVRKAVINRCRQELSRLPALDLLKDEVQLQQQVLEAQAALQQLPVEVQQAVVQQLQERENDVGRELLAQLQLNLHDDASVAAQKKQQSVQEQHSHQETATTPSCSDQSSTSSAPAESAGPAVKTAVAAADVYQQLDWESIIDFPHGSLRLIGSCKAPWMDSDPAWVTEKCYSEAQCVGGVWRRQPLSYAAVMKCSILLNAMELKVFEQSNDFLEAVYQAVDNREQILAAKRLIRYFNRALKQLQDKEQQHDWGIAAAVAPPQQLQAAQQQQGQISKRSQRKIAKDSWVAQQQEASAAAQHERQQRKAAALAKLQAVAAGNAPQQQHLQAPVRPGSRTPDKSGLLRPNQATAASQVAPSAERQHYQQSEATPELTQQLPAALDSNQTPQAPTLLQQQQQSSQTGVLQESTGPGTQERHVQQRQQGEQQQSAAAAALAADAAQRERKKQDALAKLQALQQGSGHSSLGAPKPALNNTYGALHRPSK